MMMSPRVMATWGANNDSKTAFWEFGGCLYQRCRGHPEQSIPLHATAVCDLNHMTAKPLLNLSMS